MESPDREVYCNVQPKNLSISSTHVLWVRHRWGGCGQPCHPHCRWFPSAVACPGSEFVRQHPQEATVRSKYYMTLMIRSKYLVIHAGLGLSWVCVRDLP